MGIIELILAIALAVSGANDKPPATGTKPPLMTTQTDPPADKEHPTKP